MKMSHRYPRPQTYQRLLALRLRLADGTTLNYAAGQSVEVAGDPEAASHALRAALNSSYALRGFGPAYPCQALMGRNEILEFVIELYDRRASSLDRRTVVRLIPAADGTMIQSLQATSEPGEIYLYVYGTDVGEIVREVSSDVLPLLSEMGHDDDHD